MRSVREKVVLVTGASRGLGVDMARAFASRGARLALAARSAEALEKVRAGIEESGATAIAAPTDVGDLEALRALVRTVEERLGPIDVLVNNAGVEHVWNFETAPLERLDEIIQTNVLSLIRLTRLVVPSMVARGTGHVVNVSSVSGLIPTPHNSVYAASKHAVVGFSRSLRLELAEHGVEVSVVCPGTVDEGMYLKWDHPRPKMVPPPVSSKQVAEAVVGAVTRNRGEIVVGRGLVRLGRAIEGLSPEFGARLMRAVGGTAYLRGQAEANATRD